MAIKIDMAKVYDQLDWHVLKQLLLLHGFSPYFISLLSECLTSPIYSLLLQGSPFGYFTARRGIRQGDPLSPNLFTVLFDLLSRILSKAEEDGRIHGVKVSGTSPPISHLMYADNLFIYCRAIIIEAIEIFNRINYFCTWSRQAINF